MNKEELRKYFDKINPWENGDSDGELCWEVFQKGYLLMEQENARLREALVEASEYARCDDVNGEAGSICLKALEKSE